MKSKIQNNDSLTKIPLDKFFSIKYHNSVISFIFALLIPILILWLQQLLGIYTNTPYILSLSAVVASAIMGGFWTGVLTTVYTVIYINIFFITGDNLYTDFIRLISLIVYIMEGIIISWLVYRQKTAKDFASLQKEWLDITLKSIGDAVISTDIYGRITLMNDIAQNVTGWKFNDAEGKPITKILTIKNRKSGNIIMNPVETVLKEGRTKNLTEDAILINRYGKEIYIDDSAAPIKDDNNNLIGVILIFRDISSRIKIEQKVKQEEIHFKELADNIPDIISRFDLNFKRIFINNAYEKLIGKPKSTIIGKSLAETITDKRQPWIKYFKQVITTGQEKTVEAILNTINGKRYFSVRLVPEFDSENKVISILTIAQDINDSKIEEKRKEDFLSIASHELKTPITSLRAYAQLANRYVVNQNDTRIKKIFKQIEKQTDNLTILVSDLLDVTKIDAGKIILPKNAFNINDLVTEIVDETKIAWGENHRIIIKGKINKPVYADMFRIGQALSNTLINAVKYSPKNSRITLVLGSRKNEAIIAVKDQGIGISDFDQKHIFERFYQTNAANNQEGRMSSLGLGLYITSEIIKRHGGKIWVESKLGKGSTFYFTLPLFIN